MEKVKVKVIEGKVYLADSEDFDTVELTIEEWETLDKSLEYSIHGKNLIMWDDLPALETPQKQPVPTLEQMYAQNDCHPLKMIEALWQFHVFGEKKMIDELESKRAQTRTEYAKLISANE